MIPKLRHLSDLELKLAYEKVFLNKVEIQDASFKSQNDFVLDKNRFVTAQCTRRAGKSNGLGLRFFRTLQKHPGCFCPYIALTRESAKNIMWPALQDIDQKFKLGAEFIESSLTVKLGSSRLMLFGADMKNFIRRLRGIKTPGAAVDEAQEFGSHLEELIDDILVPATADYEDGWIALTGTPGPFPKGYFYDVTEGRKYGYSIHKWEVFENPYMPNARAFVEDIKKKKGWDDNHPTYLREWKNKWVYDPDALVYHYDEQKNHYDVIPIHNPIYIMGIDFGFEDADAIAILAWDEKSPITYLVEELIVNKQGLTELVNQVEFFRKKYNISKIVSDFGGLGKKLAEEMTRRYQIPMVAAEKQRKAETIELFNDALRTSRFKAKNDSRFAKDAMLLQWDLEKSGPERKIISNRFHSDILDATLYAFRESPAYSWRPEIIAPKYGTKEWQDNEVIRMEEEAQRFFEEQENTKSEWKY